MKRFLLKTLIPVTILLLIQAINPLIGLYKLHHYYYLPDANAVKLISRTHKHATSVLVIGCSNLQHNIDFGKVQDSVDADVDFLYFSGSENSTILNLLKDKNLLANYDNIILYLPYHLLIKERFLAQNFTHYKYYGSYIYPYDLITHNPLLFFYNWNSYFDSVNVHRAGLSAGSFVTGKDLKMDSLNTGSTEYNECNAQFIHAKQIVGVPEYSDKDVRFIKSLKGKNQKLFILFTPIANISENVNAVIQSKTESNLRSITLLNKPSVMDSTLFYEQWYHLNSCGRQIETLNMISNIRLALSPVIQTASARLESAWSKWL